MKTNSGKYSCKFCNREYKEKYNHDRHIQCCEFLCKSRREQEKEIDSFEKIPTQKEMFCLIQELSLRIEKLEKENSKLRHIQRKSLNFTEVLKESPKPVKQFDEFMEELLLTVEDQLENVYNNDLLKGILSLFTEAFSKYEIEQLPLRTFDIKSNMFYVYDRETSTWILLSNEDFDKILSKISHRFLVEFNRCWCVVNKQKIETEESYAQTYIEYYRRILGEGSDEARYRNIRKAIYQKIKINIKSLVGKEES